MSVLKDVVEELWSMFVGDRRLTLLVLAVVALAAAVSAFFPKWIGAVPALLLLGAAGVLADAVLQAARKSRG